MSVSLDVSVVVAQLRIYLARLDDFVPVYDAMAEYAIKKAEERIETTKWEPDGKLWAPWKPFTADLRDHKGNFDLGINWDSGDLLDSFKFEVDGNFEVAIGTDMSYAPDVQDGTPGKREARPILGWSKEDCIVAEQCVLSYITTGYARVPR